MILPYQVTGTAFITGGGSGLAKGAAFVFAQNGIQGLALLDVNSDGLNSTKKELNELHPNVTVETFTVDVTDEQAVAAAVAAVSKQFGRIDIALHAAGITHAPYATHELPLNEWQRVIDINQTGLMICEKWVVHQMLTQESRGEREGRGTIVNITSTLGVTTTRSNLGATAYVASKHAVTALTKADAKRYAKEGIRINAICPGYVDTPLTHDYIVSGLLDVELQHSAIGRPAQVDEIANAILFLSSPMSSYMFGSALVIDGGGDVPLEWKIKQREKKREDARERRAQQGYNLDDYQQNNFKRTRIRASTKSQKDYKEHVQKYQEFLQDEKNMSNNHTIGEGHPIPTLEQLEEFIRCCDSFHQIRSLILASKRLHSAWVRYERAILWRVGQVAITGFSDALIAVRATRIATEALSKGELPPDPFPASELSGDVCKPSLEELKQVQTLRYVANYLERQILSYEGDRFIAMPDSFDTDRHEWARLRWEVWREQCHRAIYRHLAAGAILYRAYHEPIVSDGRPTDFLAALIEIMESGEELEYVTDGWFSASDQTYLSEIPLYSIRDYHKSEKAFRPLEGLFVAESRKREPFEPAGMFGSRNPGRVQSLFQSFRRHADIQNPQSLDDHHAENLFHQILHFMFMVQECPQQFILDLKGKHDKSEKASENDRSTLAVFFEAFVPMNITIRDNARVSGALALPGLESKTLKDSSYFGFQYMDTLLTKVWQVGGIPNCYGRDDRPPPPQFYFAEYMLRKYFGLRFANEDKARSLGQSPWDAFAHYGSVFSNVPSQVYYDGEGLFQSSDDPLPPLYYNDAFE